LFVVLLMMLHPTQELEPPANPARFKYISHALMERAEKHWIALAYAQPG